MAIALAACVGMASSSELAAQKSTRKYEQRVAKALSGTPEDLEQLVDATLSEGPESADALVLAMQKQRDKIVAKIEKYKLKKLWDRLAAQRNALDEARQHAKALIYDEVKYFYPYKPPAVSAEKAKEYRVVQDEIDRRVDVVRELWDKRTARARVPADLFEDVARFERVSEALAQFRVRDPESVARVAWVHSLPRDGELDISTYCRTAEERERLELFARIEAFNRAILPALSKAEQRQIEITNAYRRMFGHRPVAVNLKICAAARGHSEEMARLGYFGHYSPTPGRRTYNDRLKLVGYTKGASENCALNSSAEGAHNGWTHSAGHHRNLLHPAHTEFGVGNSGKYWTQNFGRGKEYEKNGAFSRSAR